MAAHPTRAPIGVTTIVASRWLFADRWVAVLDRAPDWRDSERKGHGRGALGRGRGHRAGCLGRRGRRAGDRRRGGWGRWALGRWRGRWRSRRRGRWRFGGGRSGRRFGGGRLAGGCLAGRRDGGPHRGLAAPSVRGGWRGIGHAGVCNRACRIGFRRIGPGRIGFRCVRPGRIGPGRIRLHGLLRTRRTRVRGSSCRAVAQNQDGQHARRRQQRRDHDDHAAATGGGGCLTG